MDIKTIGVEEWLNVWEKSATWDIAQSTISSLTMGELRALDEQDGATFYERLDREKMNYGWIEGSPEFKAEVAKLYRREVNPDHILQTNGCTGANLNAIMAVVEPGDHVIAEWPTYAPLYEIPRTLGAEVEYWELREELCWKPDIEELKRLVRPNTKLICINNASNPIGTVLDADMLGQIAEIARSVGAYVLCDEVYLPLENTESFNVDGRRVREGHCHQLVVEDLFDACGPRGLGRGRRRGVQPHPYLSRLHHDLRRRVQRCPGDLCA